MSSRRPVAKRPRPVILIIIMLLLLCVGLCATQFHADIPIEEMKARYTNENSRFITVQGQEIHYRLEGRTDARANTLVLIHGTASSLHTWEPWVRHLRSDFRILRYDLPGFGLTGPRPDGDYSLSNQTATLAALMDALNIRRASLAGNSLGGHIAWRFALDYPQRVRRLILIDPSGIPGDDSGGSPLIFGLARTPGVNLFLRYFTPRALIEANLKQVYYNDDLITDELIDRYFDMTLRAGNRQAFIDRAHLSREERYNELSTLKMPVLLMWGRHDEWIPIDTARKFQDLIPDCELIAYDHAGHVPMEEIPLETANDARAFLLQQ